MTSATTDRTARRAAEGPALEQRTARLARALAGLGAAALLAACGEMAGTYGGQVALTHLPGISLSAHQVSAVGSVRDREPTVARVQANFNTPRINDAHIRIDHSANAISMVNLVTQSELSGLITIRFKPSTALGVGVYDDTVKLSFCEDEECRVPLDGSPQVLLVQLVVVSDPR